MEHYQLSERMHKIDSSQIRKIFDLAAKLPNPINLSIGQPHYPTPEPIVEELCRAVRNGHTAYTPTQGILALRERLAEKFRSVNQFSASPEDILVSSGVSSLLQLLFQCVIDKGDRVLLIEPYFLIYKSMLDFYGAKVETVPEHFKEEDIRSVDQNGLKMILFCSPSNPSGYILKETQLRALGELAEQSGALMVSDEIYEAFDYDGAFRSAASIYPKTVTLMGFSKTYSMTGLRLAAATGPSHIIKAMTVLQQYSVVCAPAPVQIAGIKALDTDVSQYVDHYRQNRDYCIEQLKTKYRFHHPDGAFYIFAEVAEQDTDFVARAIQEKQLLLVPGNIFTSSKNHVRISFAAPRETLEKGISALKELC